LSSNTIFMMSSIFLDEWLFYKICYENLELQLQLYLEFRDSEFISVWTHICVCLYVRAAFIFFFY